MSNLIRISFVTLSLLFITAGCNKEKQRMEVVKDCTGVYLRHRNGQDFKVCNDEILDNISAGTKIRVTFDNMEECFGLIEPITCGETHAFEGVLEITEIF